MSQGVQGGHQDHRLRAGGPRSGGLHPRGGEPHPQPSPGLLVDSWGDASPPGHALLPATPQATPSPDTPLFPATPSQATPSSQTRPSSPATPLTWPVQEALSLAWAQPEDRRLLWIPLSLPHSPFSHPHTPSWWTHPFPCLCSSPVFPIPRQPGAGAAAQPGAGRDHHRLPQNQALLCPRVPGLFQEPQTNPGRCHGRWVRCREQASPSCLSRISSPTLPNSGEERGLWKPLCSSLAL